MELEAMMERPRETFFVPCRIQNSTTTDQRKDYLVGFSLECDSFLTQGKYTSFLKTNDRYRETSSSTGSLIGHFLGSMCCHFRKSCILMA